MAADWSRHSWGDLASLEYGKSLRDYANAVGHYPVYGTNGRIGWHSQPLCQSAGVVIGRKGAYRGVHYSHTPFFVIDTAFYLKPKVDLDIRWAYYSLLTQDINAMDSGSAIPSTSRDEFYQLSVRLPPLSQQRAIAHILGSLDDKIELNRRMNETLEAMARTLFKSWFVDFEPVRAKADGLRPKGMDAETAAPFPNSFVMSPLGKIPSGWRVGPLSDAAEIIMGTSPAGETYNEAGEGTPLVNGPVEFGQYFPVKKKWTTAPSRFSESGDIIFCVRGSTTGRRVLSDGVYCLGRGVCSIRPKKHSHNFVYETVTYNLDRLLAKVTGSVFPNLNGPDLKNFDILIPDEKVTGAFQTLVEPLQRRIELNVREAETIAAIRDELLPKLLSGEIRVLDAERILAKSLP